MKNIAREIGRMVADKIFWFAALILLLMLLPQIFPLFMKVMVKIAEYVPPMEIPQVK